MSSNPAHEWKLNWFERWLRWIARSDSVFGSDIYVDYTHAYVWQANQFGHVLIGLILGLALIWLLGGSAYGFLLVLGLYAIKEFLDYEIAVRLHEGVFKVNRREALGDGIADWGFVALGAVIALFVMVHVPAPWACHDWVCTGLTAYWFGWADVFNGWGIAAALAAPVVNFVVLSHIYLPAKRAQDKSGMPKFVRLPTFPDNFDLTERQLEELAETVSSFAIASAKGRDGNTCTIKQIVISGPAGSGRTTLALSIGGEATNRCTKLRYLSAQRLAEKAAASQEVQSDIKQPYAVAEADLVIVDDVGPEYLPSGSIEEASDGLKELVGLQDGITVFRRPLQERMQTATSRKPLPPGKDVPEHDPALVWVLSDQEALDTAKEAIWRVFGLQEAQVLKIRLVGNLTDKRVKTAAVTGRKQTSNAMA